MSFRTKCYFIVLVAFMSQLFFYFSSLGLKSNYLYKGSIDLWQHNISSSSLSDKKTLFLGSSAVAGNNVPLRSTVADYYQSLNSEHKVFNLGILEGNLIESMSILKQASQFNVSYVFLGIEPDLFADSVGAPRLIVHGEEIQNYLNDKIMEQLRIEQIKKNKFLMEKLHQIPSRLPPENYLKFKTWLTSLATRFYGPLYSKSIQPAKTKRITSSSDSIYEKLSLFENECRDLKVKCFIYLSPIWKAETIYDKNDLKSYVSSTIEVSRKLNMPVLDLTNYLEASSKNFLDYVHLTPFGYSQVAKKLSDFFKVAE